MKKFFIFCVVALAATAFTACEYDDSDLWNKVNGLEQQVTDNTADIAALSALIDAMNNGKTITGVETTDEGYILTFSDGSKVTLRHGKDGQNGTNGKDGADGKDGTDGKDGADGKDGKDGDSIFESIEETDDEVIITLTDGRVIILPKKKADADYELRVLTFEDADYVGSEGSTYWSDFIPTSGQYGSGHGSYSWYDEGNTELLFYPVMGDFGYYAGHAGISNYVGSDWENEGNYMYDLQAYNVTGGHSGENFNTHFGYVDETAYGMNNTMPSFEFDDGVARVIDHMWVTNTTYVYNQLQAAGFGSTYVLSDESTYKIVAYGYDSLDEDAEPVASTEFYLLDKGKKFVTEWTKWDLSPLGEVVKVAFNLVGSEDMVGDYGLSVPGYFAYDDVAVRF